MDILIYAQTVFYIVASIAIIVVGFMVALVAYHLVGIARSLHKIAEALSEFSEETEELLKDIIHKLMNIPILSFFLKPDMERRRKSKKHGAK
ncbi:hypothetical protein HYT01_02130 [Candidatus Giovannonibacteria bacterium]|nr:hypothetical protein [Candidatus Giovannonibacteria bacterium]